MKKKKLPANDDNFEFNLCVSLLTTITIYQSYQIYLSYKFRHTFCEEDLVIYNGVSGMVNIILNLRVLWIGSRCILENNYYLSKMTYICEMTRFGIIIWGTILVTKINSSDHLCPDELYDFTWIVVSITWILVSLILIGSTLIWLLKDT